MLVLISTFSSLAQGGFKKKYYLQNSLTSVCRNVIEAPNGNFIMVGLTYDSLNHFNYLTLVGTDSQGNMLWRKDYGNANFRYLDNQLSGRGAVYKDGSAFYHAVCVREGSQYVSALIKFNFNGDTLWQKIYRETSWDLYAQGITKSVDGGFLITGLFQGFSSNQCLLIKTDLIGNELWRKKIPKAVPNIHYGIGIVQDTASKKIVIVGYQCIGNANSCDSHSNILILDSLGNTILQTTFNNGGGGGFGEVIQLRDKNFLTCGGWLTQQTAFVGRYNGFVVKFDTNGSVIWTKKYMVPSPWNGIIFLNELENEDIVMLGVSDPKENYTDDNTYKLQLIRTDKNGVVKFKKYIGNADGVNEETSEFARCFNPTMDKGYLIASWFQFLNSTHPFSIIKIDSTGCDTVEHWCVSVALGVNKFTDQSGFSLEFFPNPANDFINIKIDAPLDKQFTSKICDITGKEIETLELLANSNNELKTTAYAPGIYFINVFYEGKAVEKKKLIIIR